jgi:hypothetical protein
MGKLHMAHFILTDVFGKGFCVPGQEDLGGLSVPLGMEGHLKELKRALLGEENLGVPLGLGC